MGFGEVPLHQIHLSSAIVSGDVVVGVRSALPVSGITFILGNGLAGGNVWGRSGVAAGQTLIILLLICPSLQNLS